MVLGGPESCTHDWELIVDTTLPTGEPAGRTVYPSRAEITVSGPTVLAFQQV